VFLMKLASLIAALALGLAPAAFAQSAAPQGSVSGVVLDAATQKPIEGVQVTAKSASLVGEQSATTNEGGFFELTMLPPGTYVLNVSHEGYATFEPGGVDIKAKRTRLKLQIAPVEAAPPPPPAAAAVEITAPEFDPATMTAPVMLSGPAPEYTAEAVERGIEGTMTLRCVVMATGSVRGCKVTKGLPFMNRSCIEALELRRYKPALQAAKPIDVMYTFNIRLKLPALDREPRR
jgi:TonB family protein